MSAIAQLWNDSAAPGQAPGGSYGAYLRLVVRLRYCTKTAVRWDKPLHVVVAEHYKAFACDAHWRLGQALESYSAAIQRPRCAATSPWRFVWSIRALYGETGAVPLVCGPLNRSRVRNDPQNQVARSACVSLLASWSTHPQS